jgi:uncharacterized protein YyaL (SSP411 family)
MLVSAGGQAAGPALVRASQNDVDDKVITAWNGLALSAWATAARVLRRAEDLSTAQALARFLLDGLRPDGRLHRTFRLGQARQPAFLDDHSALAEGLIDLYQVDFDRAWLEAAVEMAEILLRDFRDPSGGFFDTSSGPSGLPARPKSIQDTPLPSGNAMAVSLLLPSRPHGRKPLRGRLAPLAAMQPTAARHRRRSQLTSRHGDGGFARPQRHCRLHAEGFRELAAQAHQRFLPRLVLAGGEPADWERFALLQGKTTMGGRPTAYLCHDFACRQPTTSSDELAAQLAETT